MEVCLSSTVFKSVLEHGCNLRQVDVVVKYVCIAWGITHHAHAAQHRTFVCNVGRFARIRHLELETFGRHCVGYQRHVVAGRRCRSHGYRHLEHRRRRQAIDCLLYFGLGRTNCCLLRFGRRQANRRLLRFRRRLANCGRLRLQVIHRHLRPHAFYCLLRPQAFHCLLRPQAFYCLLRRRRDAIH